MNQNFVINGVARSGKNTFVDIVNLYLKSQGSVVEVRDISSVDRVKEAAITLGWNGIKDDKGRRFLSDLKILSTDSYDGPMNYMKIIAEMESGIKFFHIREPEEIAKFVSEFPDTRTICINRKGIDVPNNAADQNVDLHDYDHYIDNNGTLEDFTKAAIEFTKSSILC